MNALIPHVAKFTRLSADDQTKGIGFFRVPTVPSTIKLLTFLVLIDDSREYLFDLCSRIWSRESSFLAPGLTLTCPTAKF